MKRPVNELTEIVVTYNSTSLTYTSVTSLTVNELYLCTLGTEVFLGISLDGLTITPISHDNLLYNYLNNEFNSFNSAHVDVSVPTIETVSGETVLCP